MNNRLTYSIYNLTQHKSACTFAVSDDHRLTTKEIVDHRHNTGADALTDCFYQITITKGDMSQYAYLISNGKQFFKYAESKKLQKSPSLVSIGTDVPHCITVRSNAGNRFQYIVEDVFRNTIIYDYCAPTKIALNKVLDSLNPIGADVKPYTLYKLTTIYDNKTYYFSTNSKGKIVYGYTDEEIRWSGCGQGYGVALTNPKDGTIYHFEALEQEFNKNGGVCKETKVAEWNSLTLRVYGLGAFYLRQKGLCPNGFYTIKYTSQDKNHVVDSWDSLDFDENGDVSW